MIRMNQHRAASRAGKAAVRLSTLLVLVLAAMTGCDFLDPTNVENPRTTTDDLARAAEPTRALLPGLRAQMARAVSANTVITEVVSDNYSVHGTGLNSALDDPRGGATPVNLNSTSSFTGNYWNLQELRALSEFVLEEIVPGDAAATAGEIAEVFYYQGMAYLMLGENFSHAPLERDGAPVPAADLLGRAVTAFLASLGQQGTGEFALRSGAALARTFRLLGMATEATQAATQVLAADADFVLLQGYDAGTINNGPQTFIVVRALKEMQPLPRLDFLDPKYLARESGIPVAKAEEMHLILAEIALAANDLAGARTRIAAAIDLALSRPEAPFVDDDERRNADLSFRPRSSDILVRADPTSPFRAGLVLDRPGAIMVPVISGTSLDADSILALTDADDVWHAFHLARQEIMFLEGRRMSDLGIRLPMMLREIDANAAIDDNSPGTAATVAACVPVDDTIDLFDPASPYDAGGDLLTNEVTLQVDMNRVMATNRSNYFAAGGFNCS